MSVRDIEMWTASQIILCSLPIIPDEPTLCGQLTYDIEAFRRNGSDLMYDFMRAGRLSVWLLAGVTLLATAQALPAQEFKDLIGRSQGGLFDSTESADPIVTVSLTPESAGRGEEVTLSIRVELAPDNYTYSMNPSFGGRTRVEFGEVVGLEPVEGRFVPDHPPKTVFEPAFDQEIEKFIDKVTWSQKYRVTGEPRQAALTGVLRYQVCDASTCRNLKREFAVALASGGQPSTGAPAQTAESLELHPFEYSETPARKPGKPEPLTFEYRLAPQDAVPGETVTLSVTADLDDEWHTFALDQDPDMSGLPTVLTIDNLTGLAAPGEGFVPSKEPEIERPLKKIVQRVHYGRITWTRDFEVTQAGYGLAGSVQYQVCRHGSCRRPMTLAFALGAVDAAAAPAIEEVAAADDAAPALAEGDIRKGGLWLFLVSAMGAGFAALLTPCVFPMIPITVSFFLKQSEKEHHRPISMALVYCAGIMVTFTGLGLLMAVIFGATQMTVIANNPWLNLGISAVLIFFGMNLLGMFEIRVPNWMLTWTAGKEGKGGVIGVLFMSLTFTLVSFTCTFAFAGLLLVWASQGEYYWPILGMLAFSAAFSLPFFFLALFPSFLQKLPKSGGWMNTVKVTMGMIEIGAAFKFLSVADLAWNPEPIMFDFALVLSAWIVICVCTGLYLLGMFRLPHDTVSESISVPRLVAAMTFLGFGGYLAVGLFAPEKPDGKVWEQIEAFLPGRFEGGIDDVGPFLEHDGLKYALDVDRAFEVAASTKQPLFLDFTGINCVNCRLMEERMAEPHNRQRLEKFLRVQLYTDNVPELSDRKLVDELLAKNRELQEDWFGDVTLPSYAVVAPEGRKILASFKGLEQDDGQFAEFLDRGLEEWRKVSAAEKKTRIATR